MSPQQRLDRTRGGQALMRSAKIDVAALEMGLDPLGSGRTLPLAELNLVVQQQVAALNEAVVGLFRVVQRLDPSREV